MDIASKEYLEKSLGAVKLHPTETNQSAIDSCKWKNEIWNAIKEFFTERDCQVLFWPVNDEAKLWEVNKLPYEDLRVQFRKQSEHLF